jgi:FkbM family methyltransferase
MDTISSETLLDRLRQTHDLVAELEPILQSLMMNDTAIIDGLAQLLGTQQHLHNRASERIDSLAADLRELATAVTALHQPAPKQPDSSSPFDRNDPELSLLAHLLPLLPNPIVLDVGANVGHVAASLVDAGFEVFAYEPFEPSFASLQQVAREAAGRLHASPLAIGAADGTAEMLVAVDDSGQAKWDTSLFHSTVRHPMLEDLSFGEALTVPMRSLASLIGEGAIPANAAVLKIDTEGADLEVIRGAGEARFSVVLMEFWERQHPFGRAGHGDLTTLVGEMRQRGYPWHLVIYRVDMTGELGCVCNVRNPPATSWGNAVFFRDFALFGAAAAWSRNSF